ncbi:MAG TPA: kinase [Hyphomonadaceae bacterium]|nr:kinase [Hyphomonadaceae bacterium]
MMATLLRKLIDETRSRAPNRPALIGVSGAQGSGKSYQCKQFAASNPRVAHFSLDDVYLTKWERRGIAAARHPLFRTRSAPGTHDLDLAELTLKALTSAREDMITSQPRFNKLRDERAPEGSWPIFRGRPDSILIDGWCLGALAPEESPPINAIERQYDLDGKWRRMVREELEGRYRRFFAAFDAIVYLKAPSWETVKRWRAEQEVENLGRALTPEDHARLDRFMQHYERITRSMMAGGHCAGWVVELDAGRRVVRIEGRAQ